MHDKKETKVEGTLSSEHIKQGFQEKREEKAKEKNIQRRIKKLKRRRMTYEFKIKKSRRKRRILGQELKDF